MFLSVVSLAFFITALMSSYEQLFFSLHVKSTTETSKVGTLNDIPVSLPFSEGITSPTILAAPVDDGIMLPAAARPPLQSFLEGPSTVFWVAVVEWTVVIKPSSIPKLSLITFARGAKQFVVQLALDTTFILDLYSFSFTPITNTGTPFLPGAVITTFFAPATKCFDAPSRSVNLPVASATYSAPQAFQGISSGSLSE